MRYLDDDFRFTVESDDFITVGTVQYTFTIYDFYDETDIIGKYIGNIWCDDTLARTFDFTELVRMFVADYLRKNSTFPLQVAMSITTETDTLIPFNDALYPAYRYPHYGMATLPERAAEGIVLRQGAEALIPQVPYQFRNEFRLLVARDSDTNIIHNDYNDLEQYAGTTNHFESVALSADMAGGVYITTDGTTSELTKELQVANIVTIGAQSGSNYVKIVDDTLKGYGSTILYNKAGTELIKKTSGSGTVEFVYDGGLVYGDGAAFTLALREGETYKMAWSVTTKSHQSLMTLSVVYAPNYTDKQKVCDIVAGCGMFLKWRDRLGSEQCQPFNHVLTYSEGIKASELTDYTGKRYTYQVEVQPKFKVNSGWIADNLYPYYESIFVSPTLTLYDATHGVAYDVIITSRDYTEKTFENQSRQMFCLTLDLEVTTTQKIIQR